MELAKLRIAHQQETERSPPDVTKKAKNRCEKVMTGGPLWIRTTDPGLIRTVL